MRKRDNSIHIRLSDDEYKLFKSAISASGLSHTDYIIMSISGTPIQPLYEKKLLEEIKFITLGIYSQIRRIGVNLNQLTFLANQSHSLSATTELNTTLTVINEQAERWNEAWQFIKSLMGKERKHMAQ